MSHPPPLAFTWNMSCAIGNGSSAHGPKSAIHAEAGDAAVMAMAAVRRIGLIILCFPYEVSFLAFLSAPFPWRREQSGPNATMVVLRFLFRADIF
jgi:hypothetical protein